MHGTTHAFTHSTTPTIFPTQKFIDTKRKVAWRNGVCKKKSNYCNNPNDGFFQKFIVNLFGHKVFEDSFSASIKLIFKLSVFNPINYNSIIFYEIRHVNYRTSDRTLGNSLTATSNTSFKMKNLELKERLNQLAIDHLEDLVHELKDEVSTKLKGDGNTDEGGFAGNGGDYSAQASNNFLSEQAVLRRAEAEEYQQTVNKLKGYKFPTEHTEVDFLSLVKTNRGVYFISQALKPLMFEGKRYYYLAMDAPIYEILKGKKPGDSFSFRGIDYTIESIC